MLAVATLVPNISSIRTALSPIRVANAIRRPERCASGAAAASNRVNATATRAVSPSARASHSGRPSHQPTLPGSGSAIPVVMAQTAEKPAIASSTGMCQR